MTECASFTLEINDIMKLTTNAENVDVLYEDNHVNYQEWTQSLKRVGSVIETPS